MDQLLQFLNGRKTYLAAAATILSALATFSGVISPTFGGVVGGICLALAHMAQRSATAKTKEDIIAAVLDGIAELHWESNADREAATGANTADGEKQVISLFDPTSQNGH